jgi:hypothetical protein
MTSVHTRVTAATIAAQPSAHRNDCYGADCSRDVVVFWRAAARQRATRLWRHLIILEVYAPRNMLATVEQFVLTS